jgi:phosphohistidine phosphatase SixA
MSYPSVLYIMRHGEERGDRSDIHLSPRGVRRAVKLHELFGPDGRIGQVDALVATAQTAHSNRCYETLAPLAALLGLTIRHDFKDDDYKKQAKQLKGREYEGLRVLLAWHHGTIPDLARALGARVAMLPWRNWPDKQYSEVWALTFGSLGLQRIEAIEQGLDV